MFKAEYEAAAQNTNDGLVKIRSEEISYFSEFFTSFGIQAALIAGFQFASISQVYVLYPLDSDYLLQFYWISTAFSICSSIHVLLCCVYIVVFGQGLALRGPVGSMARALSGMVVEQQHIIFSFRFNIQCLAFSIIATYHVVMTNTGAIICTCIMVVGMMCWQVACNRIFSRFKMTDNDENATAWNGDPTDQYDLVTDQYEEEAFRQQSNDGKRMKKKIRKGIFFRQWWGHRSNSVSSRSSSVAYTEHDDGGSMDDTPDTFFDRKNSHKSTTSEQAPAKRRKSHSSLFRSKSTSSSRHPVVADDAYAKYRHRSPLLPSASPLQSASNSQHFADQLPNRSGAGYGLHNVIQEGYLTMFRTGDKTTGDTSWLSMFALTSTPAVSKTLVRRYAVLTNTVLIIYGSRELYLDNPERPVMRRPFELTDYYLVGNTQSHANSHFSIYFALVSDVNNAEDDCSETSPMMDKSIKEIEFRCDTQVEVDEWTYAFSAVMKIMPGTSTGRALSHGAASGRAQGLSRTPSLHSLSHARSRSRSHHDPNAASYNTRSPSLSGNVSSFVRSSSNQSLTQMLLPEGTK